MNCIVMEVSGGRAVVLDRRGGFLTVPNRNYCIGQKIRYFPAVSAKRIVSIAACFLMIFCGIGGYKAYFTPVSYMSIDINPSIQLALNIFNRVIDVSALNGDGEIILETISVKNNTAEDSVKKIIDCAQDKGYLSGSDKSVIINIIDSDNRVIDKIAKVPKDYSSLDVIVERASNSDMVLAEDMGISIGRARTLREYSEAFGGTVYENHAILKDADVMEIKEKTAEATTPPKVEISQKNLPENQDKPVTPVYDANTLNETQHGAAQMPPAAPAPIVVSSAENPAKAETIVQESNQSLHQDMETTSHISDTKNNDVPAVTEKPSQSVSEQTKNNTQPNDNSGKQNSETDEMTKNPNTEPEKPPEEKSGQSGGVQSNQSAEQNSSGGKPSEDNVPNNNAPSDNGTDNKPPDGQSNTPQNGGSLSEQAGTGNNTNDNKQLDNNTPQDNKPPTGQNGSTDLKPSEGQSGASQNGGSSSWQNGTGDNAAGNKTNDNKQPDNNTPQDNKTQTGQNGLTDSKPPDGQKDTSQNGGSSLEQGGSTVNNQPDAPAAPPAQVAPDNSDKNAQGNNTPQNNPAQNGQSGVSTSSAEQNSTPQSSGSSFEQIGGGIEKSKPPEQSVPSNSVQGNSEPKNNSPIQNSSGGERVFTSENSPSDGKVSEIKTD